MERGDDTVGWICAILDGPSCSGRHTRQIGVHNVAIACLPSGVDGHYLRCGGGELYTLFLSLDQVRTCWSASAVEAPSAKNDIRLGDVMISKSDGTSGGGVIPYDFGKTFTKTSVLWKFCWPFLGSGLIFDSGLSKQLMDKINLVYRSLLQEAWELLQ